MEPLTKKRMIRLSLWAAVLIAVMYFLEQNGYWLNTQSLPEKFGWPVFLGSLWFNLLAVPLVALSVYLGSNEKFRYGLRSLLTAWVITIAALSILTGSQLVLWEPLLPR